MIYTNGFKERLDDAGQTRAFLLEYAAAVSASNKMPEAKFETVQAALDALELGENPNDKACYEAFCRAAEKQVETLFDFADVHKELAGHQAVGFIASASGLPMTQKAILDQEPLWEGAVIGCAAAAKNAISMNKVFMRLSEGGTPALNTRAKAILDAGFAADSILHGVNMRPTGEEFDRQRFSIKKEFTEMQVRVVEAATLSAQSVLVRMFKAGSMGQGQGDWRTSDYARYVTSFMGQIKQATDFSEFNERDARDLCAHLDQLSIEMTPAGKA